MFPIFLILLPFTVVGKVQSIASCYPDVCNFEGYCSGTILKPQCSCLKNYYTGKTCSQVIDHCAENPCNEEIHECIPHIGGYFCRCKAVNVVGKDCDIAVESNLVNPRLIFNHIAYVNERGIYLFVMNEHFQELYNVRIILDKGVIFNESITIGNALDKFVFERSLQIALKKYHMRNADDYPTDPIVYMGGNFGPVSKEGTYKLTLYVDYDGYPKKNLVKHDYYLAVIKRRISCQPYIKMSGCNSKETDPLYIRISKDSEVVAEVTRSCGSNSELTYSWVGKDEKNNKIEFTGSGPQLSIPAHGLSKNIHGTWSITVKTGEFNSDEDLSGYSSKTCYVKYKMDRPKPVIKGGHYREVDVTKTFAVDGTSSSDPMQDSNAPSSLLFSWSCKPSTGSTNAYCKDNMSEEKILTVPGYTLTSGVNYTYSLTVTATNRKTNKEASTTQIVHVVGRTIIHLKLICVKNCASGWANPDETISLLVICSDCKSKPKFIWTINPAIADTGTALGMKTERMIVLKNVLTSGESYTFAASGSVGDLIGKSSMNLTMNSPPIGGSCIVSPSDGISSVTMFKVSCSGFKDDDHPLFFNVYQKITDFFVLMDYAHEDDADEIETQLSEGDPKDNNKALLQVRVRDSLHMSTTLNLTVIVSPMVLPDLPPAKLIKHIQNMYKSKHDPENNIEDLITAGDTAAAISIINNLINILPKLKEISADNPLFEAFEKEFLKDVLKSLLIIRPIDYRSGLQKTTMLAKLLTTVTVDDYEGLLIAKVLNEVITTCLNEDFFVVNSASDNEDIVRTSLTVLSALTAKTNTTHVKHGNTKLTTINRVNEDYPIIEDYPDYGEFDIEILTFLDNMAKRTNLALNITKNLGALVFTALGAGEPPLSFRTSDMYSTYKVDVPERMVDTIIKDPENNDSYIHVDKEFLQNYLDYSEGAEPPLQVQFSSTKSNPFWWHPEFLHLNSSMIHTDLSFVEEEVYRLNEMYPAYHKTFKSWNLLKAPLDIYIKPSTADSLNIQGKIRVPGGKLNEETVDQFMAMHEMIGTTGSYIYVNFDKSVLSRPIRLIIRMDQRPTYSDFKHASIISKDSTITEFFGGDSSSTDDSIFFVALFPLDEDIAQATGDVVIEYSFKMFIAQCKYWDMELQTWSTKGCELGPNSTQDVLHCRCRHFSLFSSEFYVTPNRLSRHDLKLLLKMEDNYIIISALGVLFAVYLIAFCYACRRDRYRNYYKIATFLESNNPTDSYAYCLAVHTGVMLHAGTTSHVAVILEGTGGTSSAHLLTYKRRHILATGTDDWFILTTPSSLGQLRSITIWQDYFGRHPDWYVEKVVAWDLQTKQCWSFLIYDWMSVIRGRLGITCIAYPASSAEIAKINRRVPYLIIQSFRETHKCVSIAYRHPRSPMSSKQFLTVVFATMLLQMLASLMFYGIPTKNPADQAEYGTYKIDNRVFLIPIQSSLIVIPLSITLKTIFSKSAPHLKKFDPDCFEVVSLTLEQPKGNRLSRCLKNKYWFPWWFSFIAWIISAGIIVSCSFLISIYGLKYGPTKSYLWLTSIVFGIFQEMFISGPISLVIYGTVIGVALKGKPRVFEPVIRMPKQEQRKKSVYYKRFRDSLVTTLENNMSRPLSKEDVKVIKKKQKFRKFVCSMIPDVLMFFLFITTLHLLVLGLRNRMLYKSTKNAMDMTAHSKYKNNQEFEGIHTNEILYTYLNDTVLPALFAQSWYDGFPIKGYGWVASYNSKLLGIPRIRQLRVTNQSCVPARLFKPFISDCNGEFSFLNMDTKDYRPKWEPYSDSYFFEYHSKVADIWIFKDEDETDSKPILATLHNYPGSGYVGTLGRTLNNSRSVLQYMVDTNWIDEKTRAIFIEFTLFNANENLFNVFTLIAERTGAGTYVTSYKVYTVHLMLQAKLMEKEYYIVFCAFVLICGVYFVRKLLALYQQSLNVFIRNPWNIVDMIILSLSLAVIALHTLRSHYVENLMDQVELTANNEFINFIGPSHVDEVDRILASFLICLSTIRIWKVLRFARMFRMMEQTFFHAFSSLMGVLLIMMICLVAFSSFMHLTSGPYHTEFQQVYKGFITSTSVAFGFYDDFNYSTFLAGGTYLGYIVMFFVIFILNLLLINILISVICLHFFRVRFHTYIYGEHQSFFQFLKEEFYRFFNIRIAIPARLRGGADFKEPEFNGKAAVPKPEAIRNMHALSCSKYRMNAMQHITKACLKEESPKKVTRITSDKMLAMKNIASEVLTTNIGIKPESGAVAEVMFFPGIEANNKKRLISEDRLVSMADIVNIVTGCYKRKDTSNLEKEKILRSWEITDLLGSNLDYLNVLLDEISTKPIKVNQGTSSGGKSQQQMKVNPSPDAPKDHTIGDSLDTLICKKPKSAPVISKPAQERDSIRNVEAVPNKEHYPSRVTVSRGVQTVFPDLFVTVKKLLQEADEMITNHERSNIACVDKCTGCTMTTNVAVQTKQTKIPTKHCRKIKMLEQCVQTIYSPPLRKAKHLPKIKCKEETICKCFDDTPSVTKAEKSLQTLSDITHNTTQYITPVEMREERTQVRELTSRELLIKKQQKKKRKERIINIQLKKSCSVQTIFRRRRRPRCRDINECEMYAEANTSRSLNELRVNSEDSDTSEDNSNTAGLKFRTKRSQSDTELSTRTRNRSCRHRQLQHYTTMCDDEKLRFQSQESGEYVPPFGENDELQFKLYLNIGDKNIKVDGTGLIETCTNKKQGTDNE